MYVVECRGSGWIAVRASVVRNRLELQVMGNISPQTIGVLADVVASRPGAVLVDFSECEPTPAAEAALAVTVISAAAGSDAQLAVVGRDFARAVAAMPWMCAPAAWFESPQAARRWLGRPAKC